MFRVLVPGPWKVVERSQRDPGQGVLEDKGWEPEARGGRYAKLSSWGIRHSWLEVRGSWCGGSVGEEGCGLERRSAPDIAWHRLYQRRAWCCGSM